MTELSHYYKLPFFGTAGESDAEIIGAKAVAEITYQVLMSALSGADFIHGIGEMYQGRMASPEFTVLGSEIIDMAKVSMQALSLSERKGQSRVHKGGSYA